jgi:uncharacterized membrane-anchored protein
MNPAHGKRHLPDDDALRSALHNEVLLRPPPRMGLPVQIACVVVRNAEVDIASECAHLAKLPGQKDLQPEQLAALHLRVQAGPCTLRWERHTEFTRYTLLRALPPSTLINDIPQQYVTQLLPEDNWLANVPGTALAAIHLIMLWGEPPHAVTRATAYDHWFAEGAAVASLMGNPTHACVVSDLAVQTDGFERLLVIATPGMSEPRAGRIAQRLLDLETYRVMAVQGLHAAQHLMPQVSLMESELAVVNGRLRNILVDNQALLDQLIPISTQLERHIADHRARFDASRVYADVMAQRLIELREKAAPETRTLTDLLQRRIAPAMATMEATAQRMTDLSGRIGQTTTLLQTRIHAVTEAQNRQVIASLRDTKLVAQKLQRTIAGLAIAVSAYFLVSLALQLTALLRHGA